MKISALIAENVRNFEGEHIIDLNEGLNVFIGKNNTGKSTLLRVPGLVERQFKNGDQNWNAEMFRDTRAVGQFGVRWMQNAAQAVPFLAAALGETKVTFQALGVVEHPLLDSPAYAHWPAGEGVLDVLARKNDRITSPVFRLPGSGGDGPITSIAWAGSYELKLARKRRGVELKNGPEVELMRRLRLYFTNSPFTSWAHRQIGIRDEYGQHKKRLLDANDDDVQATLTFLKLKHEHHFATLANALRNALPEFRQLDFEEFGTDYKPAFKLNHADQLLTRDLVGSGSWTFLSILTAAHAAVATGAETIVLDEPHLYLHPGLERRLVRELTNEETWKGKAPQLLVATHSPVFLDAAWRKGKVYLLDWEDENRTKVKAHELTKSEIQGQLRNAVSVSTISDLLYADRIVFVEGASDVKTLEVLTESITFDGASIRFEPLKSPDNIRQQAFVNALRAVSRGFSTVPGVKPVLLLDADKRVEIEAVWRDMESSPRTGFEVYWAGATGHDMESIFADAPFLTAFFAAKGILDESLSQTCVDAVAPIFDENLPPPKKHEKASQRLFALHEQWIPDALPSPEEGGKTVLLEALATFYRSDAWNKPLTKVEELIATLKGPKP